MPVDHVKFNPMASNVSWRQQLCKHHTVLSVLEWSPINRMFLSLVLCWSWCWPKVLAEICLTGNDVEVGIMWLVAFLINQWDLSFALADQSEEGCEYHCNMSDLESPRPGRWEVYMSLPHISIVQFNPANKHWHLLRAVYKIGLFKPIIDRLF